MAQIKKKETWKEEAIHRINQNTQVDEFYWSVFTLGANWRADQGHPIIDFSSVIQYFNNCIHKLQMLM